jgi:DNA-directed RNA polymerase specialized sigma24 family protein
VGERNKKGGEHSGLRLRSSRYPTQQSLVAAIAQGDESAILQLFTLYAPMLREEARRLNVAGGDRDHLVCTVLDDVVMRFVESPITPPALTTYVVNALHNRVRTQHRNSVRERATDEKAYATYGGSSEAVVAECHSEYGIRTSTDSGDTFDCIASPALNDLAALLVAQLSLEDHILVVGVDRNIPLRDLARELGITHGAARVRLSRLRQRIGRVAIEYAESLPPVPRRELQRFLRRANVALPAIPRGERVAGSDSRPLPSENKS